MTIARRGDSDFEGAVSGGLPQTFVARANTILLAMSFGGMETAAPCGLRVPNRASAESASGLSHSVPSEHIRELPLLAITADGTASRRRFATLPKRNTPLTLAA